MLTVDDLLNSFDEHDIKQILSDFIPGIRHNSRDGYNEILGLFESIPILKTLVASSLHQAKMGRHEESRKYNVIINMLIMIYKKDKNAFIDRLMK